MKLRIVKKITEEVDVEVVFPFYRKHDIMEDDYEVIYFYRVGRDETLEISRTERFASSQIEFSVKLERTSFYASEDIDYLLGRGEYACSEEEFHEVLKECHSLLDSSIK
jgi:hypothetical protein